MYQHFSKSSREFISHARALEQTRLELAGNAHTIKSNTNAWGVPLTRKWSIGASSNKWFACQSQSCCYKLPHRTWAVGRVSYSRVLPRSRVTYRDGRNQGQSGQRFLPHSPPGIPAQGATSRDEKVCTPALSSAQRGSWQLPAAYIHALTRRYLFCT